MAENAEKSDITKAINNALPKKPATGPAASPSKQPVDATKLIENEIADLAGVPKHIIKVWDWEVPGGGKGVV